MIIDAGGGTIDISTYIVLKTGPLQVEELYESECELDGLQYLIFRLRVLLLGLLQGGEFVTARARAMVQGAFYYPSSKPVTQSTTREIERVQVQHARRPGCIFPQV